MASSNIKLNDLAGTTLTVTVTPSRQFRFRIWIAVKLITLAAMIMRSRVAIQESGEEEKLATEIKSIKVLSLQPNDTLVVKCDQSLTVEQADRLKKLFEAQLAGIKIAVLDKGLSLDVLRHNA